MSEVVVSDLHACYDGDEVLRGVDLTIPDGALTAVLGQSGCGKSTLLRVIAGFLRPTAGEVRIDDRLVAAPGQHTPPEQRRVGIVPQEGGLFPHLDVAGNIGFALPRRERARRVPELLELVGLPGMQKARPHELSGGMQQRVAVARALAPQPDVVLLDEPFSALDVSLREAVRGDVLAALRASGTTCVLVTHDQEEALSSADQVAVMRDGRIAQAGSPRQVYEHPVDRALAEFIGECNSLPVQRLADGRLLSPIGALPATVTIDPVGDRALLRPEHIRAERGSSPTAVVTDVSFRGHDVVLGIRMADGSELRSRMLASADVPEAGDEVELRVVGV